MSTPIKELEIALNKCNRSRKCFICSLNCTSHQLEKVFSILPIQNKYYISEFDYNLSNVSDNHNLQKFTISPFCLNFDGVRDFCIFIEGDCESNYSQNYLKLCKVYFRHVLMEQKLTIYRLTLNELTRNNA